MISEKETLCWYCKWAGRKDDKCPWACDFKPVPGWNATPTTISDVIDSYDVHECPLFELMDEIKRGVISIEVKKSRYIRFTERELKIIKELLNEGKTPYSIAKTIGFDVGRIEKIKRDMKERDSK